MPFEYVVKFVIGANPTKPEVVAPGYYWTAINIYNASRCHDASIAWKAARALPGLVEGVTSPWYTATLNHGRGFEIDNGDIDTALRAGGDSRPHIESNAGRFAHGKGFVVLRSDLALDIVAVYTATGKDGAVAFHTERVAGRETKDENCGTLRLNLDTNANNGWQLVSRPNSTVSAPAVAYTHSAWRAATGGASWVGLKNPGTGTYVFERTFDVECDGVYTLSGHMNVRGDNGVTLELNGQSFGTVGSNFGATSPASVTLPAASLLRQGTNTLRAEVNNDGGPVGLMIDCALEIGGGTCESETRDLPTKREV